MKRDKPADYWIRILPLILKVWMEEFFRWVEPLAKILPPSIYLPFHPFLTLL